MNNNIKEIKSNGGLYIFYLKSHGRWCAKIQNSYNNETGQPKIKAFYGKTRDEVKLKVENL